MSRETPQQQLELVFPVRVPTGDQQLGSYQPTSDQQLTSSQQLAIYKLSTHVLLFLVSPDAVKKDARLVEVTLENY